MIRLRINNNDYYRIGMQWYIKKRYYIIVWRFSFGPFVLFLLRDK
jgi:hypothetical protein